jgi:hypothetical protein
MVREIHNAAHLAIRLGVPVARAIETALRAAWRYDDGTFMPEVEKLEVYRQEYERHAAGGRARAATARRSQDGKLVSTKEAQTLEAGHDMT